MSDAAWTHFLRAFRATVELMSCLPALTFCFYFPDLALSLAAGFIVIVGALVAGHTAIAKVEVREERN